MPQIYLDCRIVLYCTLHKQQEQFISYPEVRKLLKELINEVNRIGININQIVFNSNAGLYSKDDKAQLVAYMRKLNQKVNEAVVKIGNQ